MAIFVVQSADARRMARSLGCLFPILRCAVCQKQGQAEIGTEASVRTSLCFGLYDWLDGQELGFARSVTDRVAFAWLGDVVIDSALPADCARSPSARA